ncbi:synaptojanin-1 isoform X3 [Oopsacas minuta]|uniref:Synaptojanin-1 isoform X3 n=1 Tax=Oopsacas minuta TaxID=111878 RepID=A0AAV7JW38_9METZ|nr:synaptojanin-1 isoform X3 [Oopsacas minuta]
MSITGDTAPIESLVSLGIQPHPSIVEDKFSKDIRKIIRPTEKCVKSIKCMHVQESGTGSMKSLALINSVKEDALFLFCPFTSEKQLNRANTGADLLVLEDFIAITPAVDIQQKTTGRKRASMLEESEVDITITVGNTQILSLLLPCSVTLLEILQKVKQAIHNSRNQELVFSWLEYYRELIAVTNPEEIRNSLLLSNSIEDSCTVPLIDLDNSNSPPKHSYTHQEHNITTLDPFSPMRKYSQDSVSLTSADIQLFENRDTFLKVSRHSKNVNREERRKEISRSESNLVKFKEHKKVKKQSYDDQGRLTSSFSTFYTDMDPINSNGESTTVTANKRNSKSDNDLRMDISLSSSSSASNHSPSAQHKHKVRSVFYITPGETDKDTSLDVMYQNSSESQEHSVIIDDVKAGFETSNLQMENFAQSRADSDPHFRTKSKKKFPQAIGTAIRTIQDNWATSHGHQEPQRPFHKGPLQLADNERRRMSASLREKVVYSKMRARHAEFTYQDSHFILVTTFNVNGKPSPPSLRKWLTDTLEGSRMPDLYVIGFQELDLSPEALMTSGNKMEDEWKEAIEVCFRDIVVYRCVKALRMVGVYLLVYCKAKLYSYISEVDSHSVPTGVLGIIGNKGGVSIRFRFHHTEICFVNSHLAAHVSEVERRNQDFNDILTKTRFEVPLKTKTINAHDIVVWLGDLNYRLITTPEVTIDTLKELIAKEEYEKLYEYDQLRIEIEKDRVFSEFFEAPLSFKPTYKYNPGTDDWDSSEKHRPPAWCDRILWRGSNIGLLDYKSHPQIKISDHKPVSAYFEGQYRQITVSNHEKVHGFGLVRNL